VFKLANRDEIAVDPGEFGDSLVNIVVSWSDAKSSEPLLDGSQGVPEAKLVVVAPDDDRKARVDLREVLVT
jgi:hypothetical protein